MTAANRQETVHFMRESSARKGAYRLICGANPRHAEAWVRVVAEGEPVTCPTCVAILDREAVA